MPDDVHEPGSRAGLGGVALAALAGAAVGSLLEGLAFPGALGTRILGTKFLVLWPGNAVLALGAGLLATLLAGRLSCRAHALAWWWGLAPGLGALAGSFLADPHDYLGPWAWAVPAVTGLFLLVGAAAARRLPALPRGLAAALALGGVLGAVLLAAGVGASTVGRGVEYDPAARPRLGPPVGGGEDPPPAAPDVLFISVDTLRADAVLGEVAPPTPHLDALRRRALWSDHALAPAPATLPSHITMFTGVNPVVHGTRANTGRLPESIPTLAEAFQAAGWRTVGVVSNGVLRPGTGVERGFEIYANLSTTHPGVAAAKALQGKAGRAAWIGVLLANPVVGSRGRALYQKVVYLLLSRRLAASGEIGAAKGSLTRDLALALLEDLEVQERPWFFFLHFMDPHQPYEPDPSVAGRLTRGLEMPPSYRGQDPGSLLMARTIMADLQLGKEEARAAAEYLHKVYQEEVLFMDECVGRVLAKAEAAGRPLVVVFTSDHGEQFGEHDLMIHNNSVYEPLLRVPFLLAGPGVPPGPLPVRPHLEDLLPTLLGLCGLPVPAGVEGRDLLALLRQGGGEPEGGRVYVGTSPEEMAVYQGDWKLILRYRDLGSPEVVLEPRSLYRLDRDPGETKNLLETEPEMAGRLLALARREAARARRMEEAALTAAEEAILEQLGYGGG